MNKQHIILCGDSIFENSSYVNQGEPDVAKQVSELLPDSKVTLLAVDGDYTQDVNVQLRKLPNKGTHMFISVGGNDGLKKMDLFRTRVNTVGEALDVIYGMRKDFEDEYKSMLENALSFGIPLTLCSIYYPRFESSALDRVIDFIGGNDYTSIQKKSMAGLAVYNDIITKEAFKAGVPLIDLRVLCNNDEDFANPIEPSAIGGKKIAKTIKKVVLSHDFSDKTSTVYC